jgi:hypothetical protein
MIVQVLMNFISGNRLLGSCAVYFWLEPTFRRDVSPPSSGQVNSDENILSRCLQILRNFISVSHLLHRSMADRTFSCDTRGHAFSVLRCSNSSNRNCPICILYIFQVCSKYSNINSFIHCAMVLQLLCWALASYSVPQSFFTDGRSPCTGNQPVVRPLPIHRAAQTQNKLTKTSMPWMGFEPTIPDFEQAKIVHTLDRAATVLGKHSNIADLNLKCRKGARVWIRHPTVPYSG